jgi:2-haloacid dehalogenase
MTEPWYSQVKALVFDVFGTCVDWRYSVEEALRNGAAGKVASAAFASLPDELQTRVKEMTSQDWADFAQAWRNSYGNFTWSFVPGLTEWKDIDTHHRDSLIELLDEWELSGLYDQDEIEKLSKTWHFLRPWPDSSEGIHLLGTKLVTCTLSNGNNALLVDLNSHGDLGFRKLISAEDFRAYKPNPAVYLGACETLGLAPQQVIMVAAHLGDLAAARSCGLKTAYVERSREEEWEPGQQDYEEAREWVDVWIGQDQGGFVKLAEELGIHR